MARDELHGLRPTAQRVAVLNAVERLGVFASAQSVHQELTQTGQRVGLSTVYRSLHALAEHGTLDSARAPGGEMVYRRCADAPHHHLVCRQCGATVELPGGEVARLVGRWARRAAYVEVEHSLEVFGVCASCVNRARSS